MKYIIFILLTITLSCSSKKDPIMETLTYKAPVVDSLYLACGIVQKYKNKISEKNLGVYVGIKIVYQDGILGPISSDQANSTIISNLNTSFNKTGISFILLGSELSYFQSNIGNFVKEFPKYELKEYVTIVVYPSNDEVGINGIAAGVPSTVVGIVADRIGKPTLPHEMGHALGLKHIFEPDYTDGKNIHTGDGICDTPSYNIMNQSSLNCTYIGAPYYTEEDLKIIIPNYENYSYEKEDCRKEFTPGQILVMKWHLQNFPALFNTLQ